MSRDRHLGNNGAALAVKEKNLGTVHHLPGISKTPMTLQITEEDRNQAMQLLNEELFHEGGARQEVLGNIVLAIFRSGVFRGVKTVGAVIIEDKTRPVTFKAKFKALFRRG
jgi:hypothetical protein